MTETVTLQLTGRALQRYQRGATAARKSLEDFLVERLMEVVPPLVDDLPSSLQEELKTLEQLDDDTLRQVARSQLSPVHQRQYSRLLTKNSRGTITTREQELLSTLGEQARLLTLKAAHADMVLKWRGHRVPSLEELQRPG